MAGISRDRPPVVGLCIRRVCLDMTSIALHSNQWRQRAQHEDQQRVSARGQSTLSPLGFRLWLSCFNYPLIYSRSKDSFNENNAGYSIPVRIGLNGPI